MDTYVTILVFRLLESTAFLFSTICIFYHLIVSLSQSVEVSSNSVIVHSAISKGCILQALISPTNSFYFPHFFPHLYPKFLPLSLITSRKKFQNIHGTTSSMNIGMKIYLHKTSSWKVCCLGLIQHQWHQWNFSYTFWWEQDQSFVNILYKLAGVNQIFVKNETQGSWITRNHNHVICHVKYIYVCVCEIDTFHSALVTKYFADFL